MAGVVLYCLTVDIELARQQWQDGTRRVADDAKLITQVDHVVAAISRLEAAGGVERWSLAAQEDDELARSLVDAQAEQRRLRPEIDAGIGGSTRTGSLKCLHAHAAFALARPGYELGDRILAELPSLWPDSCCTA